jgi:hypothetical protein
VYVRVRESNRDVNNLLLEHYVTADDFTLETLHEIDEQIWFRNSNRGWSIITEDTWIELGELAEEHALEGRTLYAFALTKEE